MWSLIILALLFTALLAFVLAGYFLRVHARMPSAGSAAHYDRIERRNMPAEIAQGQLVFNEQNLWRRGARPLVAKMDQVFLTPAGVLVPVETKARTRVTAADIVQLSVQAVVLRYDGGGRPVARWGYVRLARPGRSPVYEQVKLLTEAQVDQLRDRWAALRGGAAPTYRPKPSLCRNCTVPACQHRVAAPEMRNRPDRAGS